MKLFQDCSDEDVNKHLTTTPLDPLQIVAFANGDGGEGDFTGLYIVGDGIKINVNPNGTLIVAVLTLLGCFYTLMLTPPNCTKAH